MKITQYQQMMAYLMRPKFNGGGSVGGNFVKPKKKPEKEVKKRKKENFEKVKDALENPDEVKEMIDKPKRGLVDEPGSYAGKSAAERQREYRERNPYKLKTTDIVADGVKYSIPNNAMKPENAKGFIKFLNKLEKDSNLENYRKLIAKESKPVQKVIRSYRAYLQNEKAGAFATGSGENLKKLFDELKLPKKSKNFLSKIGTTEIKKEIQKTRTAAAGKAAKDTSMDVVNEVRDIFVNDPNNAPSLDEVAEGLEGTKKFNAASASEKIKMRTRASNGVAQFLQAVTADRKVKGFKDIAPETLGEIIQYIDDNKRGQFRFAEGLIRDYKIKLRDSKIGGDFGKQRRNIPGQKGKVIDEVFGLSATFEDAPGYTENVQFISDEANKLKRTQIDKPFAAILKAVKNGRDTVTFDKEKKIPISQAIKDFNNKSKVFSNVNKISTPQIFVGDNLDATKLVSNFDKYSPQAQQNIKQLAKQGFILNSTKPATPVGKLNFTPGMQPDGQLKDLPGGNRKGLNLGLLKGAGETIKAIPTLAGGLALNLAFQPDLSSGVDRAALGAEAAFAPELVRQASRVTSNPIVQRFFNLGLSPKMAMRAARIASPIGLATLAGEGLYQAGKYAIDRRKELQSMSPVERDRLRQESDAFSFNEFSAAGGGIAKLAGKSSGRPPESGPTPQGLDFLIKRGRQS